MRKLNLSIAARTLGALALLVVGGVHFQVYQYEFYSAIPTIGPLFLVNFVAATGLGLFLLVPIRPPGRLGALVDRLAAIAGIGVAAGAFVGLLISEQTTLFGFREQGYRFVIVLALASEMVAVTVLSLFLARQRTDHRGSRRGGSQRQRHAPASAIDHGLLPTAQR
jgi:hypothetical protein